MNIFKYIFICGLMALAAVSCNENKETMGPEAVVEAFSRAVAAGDFDAAYELCDTAGMKPYLDGYRERMASLRKKDSSALAIAASMLAGADFEVEDVERNGGERIVKYTLRAGEDSKTKTAVVANEEGEWRVKAITDAI